MRTIRYFGRKIYDGIITLDEASEEQINLKDKIDNFNSSARPNIQIKKKNRKSTVMNAKKYEHVNKLLKSRQKVFNAFKSEVFTVKSTQVKRNRNINTKEDYR